MAQSVVETGSDNLLAGGIYRHKETGAELICIEHPKFGNPQAAAAVRVGYEFVRSVSGEELNKLRPVDSPELVNPSAAPLTSQMGSVKSVVELEAELAEAKAREVKFTERREEAEKESAKLEKANKVEEKK